MSSFNLADIMSLLISAAVHLTSFLLELLVLHSETYIS